MKISTVQGFGFLAVLLIGIPVLFVSNPGCACGSPKDLGKRGLEEIQKAQNQYFNRYGNFAPSLALLQEKASLSLPPRYSQQFRYSVQTDSDLAIAFATPIQKELPVDLLKLGFHKLQFKSAMSLATSHKGVFAMLLCESVQPTTQKIQLSLSIDPDHLDCPQGTQKLYLRS